MLESGLPSGSSSAGQSATFPRLMSRVRISSPAPVPSPLSAGGSRDAAEDRVEHAIVGDANGRVVLNHAPLASLTEKDCRDSHVDRLAVTLERADAVHPADFVVL